MILEYVLGGLSNKAHGQMDGNRGCWVPPVLQTCTQLRVDGLPLFSRTLFSRTPVHFTINNFVGLVKEILPGGRLWYLEAGRH
jgi:hypothetical protein